ncbi:MAG: GNAT family N-acetyltransferase [Actinomycetota bacterium]|nr:GNAT family N-acetyltransferase [Actinomycetota bacterium]
MTPTDRNDPAIRTRRASADDAGPVADVYLRSRHASVPAIPPLVHDDPDVRRHFREVVLVDHETHVAETPDGAVIALLVLDADWLDHLYVDPAWTGRGVGTALVDLAKRRRPGGLQLWAFEANVDAHRFYERHGFVVAERTDGSGNEERTPDRRYVWPG